MYIVTGGAGFIGSAFVSTLNAKGIHDIPIVDSCGESENWKNLRGKRFLEYVHKDTFLDWVTAKHFGRFGKKPTIDAIVHLGACSSTTELDFDFLVRNNVEYSRVLAEYSVERGIRFVYASSAATYGDGSKGYSDSHEQLHTLIPLNRYGYSKHLFDLWAFESGLLSEVTGLKFFNVYGPNEYHKGQMVSVVHTSYRHIKDSGTARLFKSYRQDFGHGEQKRDFVYVRDCCDVLWWLINTSGVTGIFNLGTGKARSWNDLARAVFQALGATPQIEYIEMPEALRFQYQYFTEAKMDKLGESGYKLSQF